MSDSTRSENGREAWRMREYVAPTEREHNGKKQSSIHIGHVIAERRKAMGLEQKDIARRVRKTQQAVSKTERTKRPHHETIELYARALEVTPEWLRSGGRHPDEPDPTGDTSAWDVLIRGASALSDDGATVELLRFIRDIPPAKRHEVLTVAKAILFKKP